MKLHLIALILAMVTAVPSFSYALGVGDEAPDFEAPSTHGNVILSEFEGEKNVILAFYYADFSPV